MGAVNGSPIVGSAAGGTAAGLTGSGEVTVDGIRIKVDEGGVSVQRPDGPNADIKQPADLTRPQDTRTGAEAESTGTGMIYLIALVAAAWFLLK